MGYDEDIMAKGQEIIPYEEVFRALNAAKINYLVCGGAAVVMLGFSRLTIDLDLIVGLQKENLEKLYGVLAKLGYKTSAPIAKNDFCDKAKLQRLAEEKNMKVVSFYHPKDPFKVIDIGVNLPDIDQILKNKKNIQVDDLPIPTIFIKDLIKMKEDLARPKDLIDAQNLKEIQKYEKRKRRNDWPTFIAYRQKHHAVWADGLVEEKYWFFQKNASRKT